MPSITFSGKTIVCEQGANLRRVLNKHKLPLYNGVAKNINCRGLGTCGTCAVEIRGAVSPPTAVERWRINFPPHQKDSGLRLACQCRVQEDIEVRKHGGMWGEKIIS